MLRRQPDLAFFPEPRHVWTWGNSRRPDDVLTEEHATPRIIRHIHWEFDRFVQERGGRRLAEKTPSNCLRVRFVQAVYPDAKFILILRDGRSVIESTQRILEKGVPIHRVWRRARQTPLSQWPAQVSTAMSTLARRMTGRSPQFWGPRPPGWREWVRAGDPMPVVLARQWAGTLLRAYRDTKALGEGGALCIRYEDLVRGPRPVIERIAEFARLAHPGQWMQDMLETVDPSRVDAWRDRIGDETLSLIRPHMEPALDELGYTW